MIRYREMAGSDHEVLEDFLYLAIHQTDPNRPVPRSAVRSPNLAIYTSSWGRPGDTAILATSPQPSASAPEIVIGAAWARILSGDVPGYGNVDAHTPEFAISVRPEFRRRGVGEELLSRLISRMAAQGYAQVSLSVQKTNAARRLYDRVGFTVLEERADDVLMVKYLLAP